LQRLAQGGAHRDAKAEGIERGRVHPLGNPQRQRGIAQRLHGRAAQSVERIGAHPKVRSVGYGRLDAGRAAQLGATCAAVLGHFEQTQDISDREGRRTHDIEQLTGSQPGCQYFASGGQCARKTGNVISAFAMSWCEHFAFRKLTVALGVYLSGCGSAEAPPPQTRADARAEGPCNGSVASCGRTYDTVAIAATHNAFAYANGGPVEYIFPNQDRPIPEQLRAGIRGLGLRPCPYFGSDPSQAARVYVTHNSDLRGLLGTEPLDGILADIKAFLDANPREVVTLYLESTVTPAELAFTFEGSGLGPYLFALDPARGWPTLDDMIAGGTRLVVFNDSQDASRPPWMLYLYDHIVDTNYNVLLPSAFPCAYYRGAPSNRIYFLNHFLDLPLPSTANIVNAADFILSRVHRCQWETGRRASVVYVDLFREGDVMGAVRALDEEN